MLAFFYKWVFEHIIKMWIFFWLVVFVLYYYSLDKCIRKEITENKYHSQYNMDNRENTGVKICATQA